MKKQNMNQTKIKILPLLKPLFALFPLLKKNTYLYTIPFSIFGKTFTFFVVGTITSWKGNKY